MKRMQGTLVVNSGGYHNILAEVEVHRRLRLTGRASYGETAPVWPLLS